MTEVLSINQQGKLAGWRAVKNIAFLPVSLLMLFVWAKCINVIGTTDSFVLALLAMSISLAAVYLPVYNFFCAIISFVEYHAKTMRE
jgi:hypothetical protein